MSKGMTQTRSLVRRAALAATAVSAAFVLAACGSDDGSDTGAESGSAAGSGAQPSASASAEDTASTPTTTRTCRLRRA